MEYIFLLENFNESGQQLSHFAPGTEIRSSKEHVSLGPNCFTQSANFHTHGSNHVPDHIVYKLCYK